MLNLDPVPVQIPRKRPGRTGGQCQITELTSLRADQYTKVSLSEFDLGAERIICLKVTDNDRRASFVFENDHEARAYFTRCLQALEK